MNELLRCGLDLTVLPYYHITRTAFGQQSPQGKHLFWPHIDQTTANVQYNYGNCIPSAIASLLPTVVAHIEDTHGLSGGIIHTVIDKGLMRLSL